MTDLNALPSSLLDWVAQLTTGSVVDCRRHNARREAWRIDIRDAAGNAARYFLRIDRALAQGQGSARHLRRESALIKTLEQYDIPAQRILGWNAEHCAALQTWVEGRAELNREPAPLQHRIMLDFMSTLARLHRIDVRALNLPEFGMPLSAADHSLQELAAVEISGQATIPCTRTHPLAAFGKRWLVNHAPTSVQATVLLQGDTGPANFMFDDQGITALVDWEWGHYGDPLEDLGNIWVRDFFYPSCAGNLRPYFEHYAARSGFTLERERIHYYRVHQMVRSVIGLAYLSANPDWRMPIPLNLGYSAVIDIETCRCIAHANSPAAEPTLSVPELAGSANSLHSALALQMDNWVAPQVADAATSALTRGHAALMRYLDRKEHHTARCDDEELQSLRALLGSSIGDLPQGRAALIAHIETLRVDEETPVLAHLTRVAANQAALMAPLTEPWRHCRWATL